MQLGQGPAVQVQKPNYREQLEKESGIVGSFSKFGQTEKVQKEFYRNLTTKMGARYGSFLCPLTGRLMIDPVVAADGHTYERRAIEEYLKLSNYSPVTEK